MSEQYPKSITVATARLHDALRIDLDTEIDPAGLMLRAASRIGRLERELAAANEREAWVSVEERLPEEITPVLVFGTGGTQTRNGFDVCWRYLGYWTSGHIIPTHWRSLPLPPPPPTQEAAE